MINQQKPQLDALYADMESNQLTPLWTLEGEILGVYPNPQTIPWLWKWRQMYDIAERAGNLVPVDRGGDRRAMGLTNPGLGGLPYATNTLWAAVQWLNGQEVAPAHRHTSQALRFIIDGAGSYSTVEGDRVFLRRGDLVLNPPWYWHDHGSFSDERAIWMDGLDIPLTNYFDAGFFEPSELNQQEVTKIEGGTILKYGVGNMRPAWEEPKTDYPGLSTYTWADTEKALSNLEKSGECSPYDDIALEYINSHTGGSVLKTIACWVQNIRPGLHTKAHRQVQSSVYLLFEGEGYVVINGVRFDLEAGDMFCVPSWAAHEFRNTSASDRMILFSMHDTPVTKVLGKYREAAYEGGDHQEVTGIFGEDD